MGTHVVVLQARLQGTLKETRQGTLKGIVKPTPTYTVQPEESILPLEQDRSSNCKRQDLPQKMNTQRQMSENYAIKMVINTDDGSSAGVADDDDDDDDDRLTDLAHLITILVPIITGI